MLYSILHQKYYNGTTMHLYGIDINPLNTSEFILNGDDEYVRLYDKRNISSEPIKQFCSLLPKSRVSKYNIMNNLNCVAV